ncbi:TPA: MFS transporter [Vibrio vulnificus]|uniref:MFS transporter n=1 Tax=Vibrio vulnificus TaxID=672 RepID=UPI001A295739|nr:MFS transporter [Vibrio vulnificus]HDY8235992.1 MFS transporter [Vibrio vulnificus]
MYELGSSQYRHITIALALGSFLVFCNLYLFQPMLPKLALEYTVSETQVNWVFAATTLGLSLSLVPMAVLSEKIGRRTVMLAGLFAIPLCSAALLLNDSFLFIVICRALLGVALAAFAAVAVAYMAEELHPKAFSHAIGGYIAANSLGGISGRISGGLMSDWFGTTVAIEVMLVFTLLGVIAVSFLLPKQKHFSPSTHSLWQHNQTIVQHLRHTRVWLAMVIGGLNFALFVNLYSVMGFRLVAEPHGLPVGLASLIFLCYLGGTISSKYTGKWNQHFHPVSGMLLGAAISLFGMLITSIEHLAAMFIGLVLISFGAFFTHTLAYGWVGQKATRAKATATAMYLVHYYVGGSLGGFFLLYCWQHWQWNGVIIAALTMYVLLFAVILQLKKPKYACMEEALVKHP